eukprot:733955-Alexandrium_andersonii.AAC.1
MKKVIESASECLEKSMAAQQEVRHPSHLMLFEAGVLRDVSECRNHGAVAGIGGHTQTIEQQSNQTERQASKRTSDRSSNQPDIATTALAGWLRVANTVTC